VKARVKYSELVCQFLDDMLDENQLKEFHQELCVNEELKKELEAQKRIFNIIKDKEKVDFYMSLMQSEKRVKRQRILRNGLSITSVLLILFSVWFINNEYFSKKTNDEIFAEYYSLESPGVITMGPKEIKETLDKGLLEFDYGNYDTAFVLLQNAYDAKIDDIRAAVYLGILYIEKKDYQKAIEILKNIKDSEKTVFNEKINWYLALAYIKIGDREKAKPLLENLDSGCYKSRAIKVLEDF